MKLQASVTHEAIYCLPPMKDNAWINTVSLIVTTSPFCYASIMKQNVNPVKLISEKDRIRIVNILFKVNLQSLVIELAALLKRSTA